MMSAEPDPEELHVDMARAFLELEADDPKTVTSINGLAAQAAR